MAKKSTKKQPNKVKTSAKQKKQHKLEKETKNLKEQAKQAKKSSDKPTEKISKKAEEKKTATLAGKAEPLPSKKTAIKAGKNGEKTAPAVVDAKPAKKTGKSRTKKAAKPVETQNPTANTPAPPAPPKPQLKIAPNYVFNIATADGGEAHFFKHKETGEPALKLKAGFTVFKSAPMSYTVTGVVADGQPPQSFILPMLDEATTNHFFNELVEMERKNQPDYEIVLVAEGEGDAAPAAPAQVAANPAEPTVNEQQPAQQPQNDPNALPEVKADRYAGTPLREIDPDVIIPNTQQAPGAPTNTPGVGDGSIMLPVSEEATKRQMEAYGKEILASICETPAVRLMGGTIPRAELNRILSMCLKEYEYNVVSENGRAYLLMQKGHLSVRVPQDGGYLPVH